RDPAARGVGLVGAHDPVAQLLAGVVGQVDRGSKGHAVAPQRRIDDLGVADLALQLVDPPLDEALLLASRMVLGVFAEVSVGPRLPDGLGDRWALDALEAVEFRAQSLESAARHGRARGRHAP